MRAEGAQFGNAVLPSPCKPVYPLYPVRYAIAPVGKQCGKKERYNHPQLETTFPELGRNQYTLRRLEADSYVLLSDEYKERFHVYKYSLARNGFIEVDWQQHEKTGREVLIGAATQYIPVDSEATNIYLAISDHILTPKIAEAVMDDKDKLRSVFMQKLEISTWHKDALQKHTFDPDDLDKLVEEFINPEQDFSWSETIQKVEQIAGFVQTKMYQCWAEKSVVIALYDPRGIASELSHLTNAEMAYLIAYTQEHARKKWVSDTIDHLYSQTRLKTYNSSYKDNLDVRSLPIGTTGPPLLRAHESAERKAISARDSLKEEVQETERLKFKKDYEQTIKEITKNISVQVNDQVTWLKYWDKGNLEITLKSYDLNNPYAFEHLKSCVARGIGGICQSKDGQDLLEQWLNKPLDQGPVHLALMGPDTILKFVKKVGKGVYKTIDEYANGLQQVLSKYRLTESARHITSEVLPAMVKVTGGSDKLLISPYKPAIEAADGAVISYAAMPKKQEIVRLLKNQQLIPSAGTIYEMASKTGKAQILVPLHISRELKAQNPILPSLPETRDKVKFWSGTRTGIAGSLTLISTINTINALKSFSSEEGELLVSSLNLGKQTAGAIGASMETYSSILKHRESKATLNEAQALKDKAEFFSRWATGLGAVTAGIATITELYEYTSKNKSSKDLRLISSALYGTTFLYAMGKTADKFGVYKKIQKRAMASATTKMVAARATAFFASLPVALVIIGVDIIATIIAMRADTREKDKWRQWMRHSIWGVDASYDEATERGELNQRIWAPVVIKDNAFMPFEDAHLDIYLPDYVEGKSKLTIEPELNPMIGRWLNRPPTVEKLEQQKNGRFTHMRYKVENPNVFRNEWVYIKIKYQPNIKFEPEVQSTLLLEIYTNA